MGRCGWMAGGGRGNAAAGALATLFVVFTALPAAEPAPAAPPQAAAAPAAAVVPRPSGQSSFTFRFRPPDGLEYVQIVRTVRVQDMGPLGSQTERSVARASMRVARTPEGYTVTGRPISFTMSRDGREVREPLVEALQGAVITYRLDPDGKLLGIEGFDGLLDAVADRIPMQAGSLAPLLDARVLTDRETAEWNGRIGSFIGRTVRIGDAWQDRAPYTLPNGEDLEYFSATSFPRVEACGQPTCLLVEVSYSTDPTALAGRSGRTQGAPPGPATGPGAISSSEVSGAARRLIEPGSMRIHSESTSRTIRMHIELPGRGSVPMTLTETRDYAFEY